MTTDELSRAIAEIVGDDGFEIGSCPQGHDARMLLSADKVGGVCSSCLYGAAHDAAKHYHGSLYWEKRGVADERLRTEDHPEWRIQRGKPKPYAEEPSLIIPVAERTARQMHLQVDVSFGWLTGRYSWHVRTARQPVTDDSRWLHADRETFAEAIAQAVVMEVEWDGL